MVVKISREKINIPKLGRILVIAQLSCLLSVCWLYVVTWKQQLCYRRLLILRDAMQVMPVGQKRKFMEVLRGRDCKYTIKVVDSTSLTACSVTGFQTARW